MISRRIRLGSIGLVICSLLGPGCRDKEGKNQLRVFMADSLSRPFNVLARAFEQSNPNVELVQIPSGSVLAARKLTDGKDQADVLAVADYLVIDKLLRPKHADWYICFATNEIGIVHTDASEGVAELIPDNWFQILSRKGVKVAAANPFHDPCGYWTELCWQLADLYYSADKGGGTIVETMTAKCGEPDSRRSDSQQLLQLVESAGGIDYAFVYRSQALQHNLPFLRLPPQINLSDVNYVDFYRQAEIELPGKTEDSTFKKKGEAIIFAITIPKEAKYPDLAARYIKFLLSATGRELLTAEYLTLADEPWTYDLEKVPTSLRTNITARDRSLTTTTARGDFNG
ncbi:MAG: extracellular solute-binding protein [Planctomycetota bacterium]|nr:MAG: extracellular solute-binding protein [Planctomycetota bacterium]